jgi:hypothetical protein
MRIADGEFRDEICPGDRRLCVYSHAPHAASAVLVVVGKLRQSRVLSDGICSTPILPGRKG